MKILLYVVLFLLILSNVSLGQRTYLMLQKRNKNKNAYYKVGDEIAVRLKGNKRKISGQILDLHDSLIVFHGFGVPVKEISSLYIDEKTKWWLRYKVEQLGLFAGGGYLLVDLINTGELNKETLIISGSLICVGVIGKLLIGNRIKIKGRTRLRILEL